MRVHEAIAKLRAKRDLWARPVWWEGSGQAIVLRGDELLVVPSAKGGTPFRPWPADLEAVWQVVEPNSVLMEAEGEDDE